jgi:predicted glycogen debranching enzyme
MDNIDNENHVILSGLDVSIIQHNTNFNLAVRKYPGIFEPKGHKYLEEFHLKNIPEFTYRVGGVTLKVEYLLGEDERIFIKYTLLEAHSPTKLRLKPFLAFRNVHKLSKANFYVNTKFKSIKNGIKLKMYEGYKFLYMQFDKDAEYIHVPDWYYNVEYQEEKDRGYDYQEDLYVPGYFELSIEKGESIIFTASLNEIAPQTISKQFADSLKNTLPNNNYLNCLKNAARQFISVRNHKTEIAAGFPWFGRWGRDTFIALPGLTLYNNDIPTCKAVLDTMIQELNNGLFPNIGTGDEAAINSADAPLWFFWTLQQYLLFTKDGSKLWKEYGQIMKNILENYRKGTHYNIKMHENGLIWQGEQGKALTWMDAVVAGKPVTPRIGFAVEINALWYNAVRFTLALAKENKDTEFVQNWQNLPDLIKQSFIDCFWDKEKCYLADIVTDNDKDWSIRPNQIFACSLPYSAINEDMRMSVLDTVKSLLLTQKGIRTLSPSHPDFVGIYSGNQEDRDKAYHQGTVWIWLLGHFCEAYLQIHQKNGIDLIDKLFHSFEENMTIRGLGTVSEIYDGNPPHRPNGTISQAWSVAELLRINDMINRYK